MQKINVWARISFVAVLLTPFTAGAWGKRGHQIVGENATMIASKEPNASFLKGQSYNFGYYANVPDFIWKRPATYDTERGEHYIDLEIFEREFAKRPDIKDPFSLSRKEFEDAFPDIKPTMGRAMWRIRELNAELEKVTAQLREMKEPTGEARRKLQEKWIVLAGVLGHYIGDLSQPLHVTDNHDGQMTGQKGIHSYFEDAMVDDLYPDMNSEVNKLAARQWPQFTKKNSGKTLNELVVELMKRSQKDIPKLLAVDKKSKREDRAKNNKLYHDMIRDRLADGSLVLAEIYRRQLGFVFDNDKFYFMAGEPEYIKPGEGGKASAAAPTAVKK